MLFIRDKNGIWSELWNHTNEAIINIHRTWNWYLAIVKYWNRLSWSRGLQEGHNTQSFHSCLTIQMSHYEYIEWQGTQGWDCNSKSTMVTTSRLLTHGWVDGWFWFEVPTFCTKIVNVWNCTLNHSQQLDSSNILVWK